MFNRGKGRGDVTTVTVKNITPFYTVDYRSVINIYMGGTSFVIVRKRVPNTQPGRRNKGAQEEHTRETRGTLEGHN